MSDNEIKVGDTVTLLSGAVEYGVLAVAGEYAWLQEPEIRPITCSLRNLRKVEPKWEKGKRYASNIGNEYEVVHVFPNGYSVVVWPNNCAIISVSDRRHYKEIS